VFDNPKLLSAYTNDIALNPLYCTLEQFAISPTLNIWHEFEKQFEAYWQKAAPKGFFNKFLSKIPESPEKREKNY
jgi:hypothetical protein